MINKERGWIDVRVLVFSHKQLQSLIWLCIGLMLCIGVRLNWERVARKIFGVKADVWLEGHNVAGMLPEEVADLVQQLAETVDRRPRDASLFQETGEIIPAQTGKRVEVAQTVNRVCLARPGSNLNLLVAEIPPKISEDYFKPVYHGDSELPRVGLAINVAWGEEYLEEMLAALAREKVTATFFFVGTWVKAFPEMVREIARSGHEVANHGLYHGHPQQMKRDELKRLIMDNARLLQEVTSQKPSNLFAPPYGEVNTTIVSAAGELEYRTIMWSVDTVDWKNPGPELLLHRVLSKVEAGGIILMHPTISSMKALPVLIRSLRQKGLEPGTVSSVLSTANRH